MDDLTRLLQDKQHLLVEHEAYVKARWLNVRYDGHRVLCDGAIPGTELILSGNANCPFEASRHLSRQDAFKAAYDTTQRREQAITWKREEVVQVRFQMRTDAASKHAKTAEVWQRILSALEAQLADLLKGFTEVA